jgi:hypothetical protein
MWSFTVSFQVLLPPGSTEAFIIIHDDSTPMTLVNLDSAARKNLFEASLYMSEISCFPAAITYCYIYGDDISPELTLLVARPPLTPVISIRDALDQNPTHPTSFSVSFYIHWSGRPEEQLLWVPIATRLGISDQAVPMSPAGESFWSATITPDCGAPQPFVYKYIVVCPKTRAIVHMEPGRAHLLFVDAPIGGPAVSVYDNWADELAPFAYLSRPLRPFAASRDSVTVNFEIVTKEPVNEVLLRLSCDPPHSEMIMVQEGAWFGQREFPKHMLDFTFSLLIRALDTTASWHSRDGFRIYESNAQTDAVLCRRIGGSAFTRSFAVYVPLVSLRVDGRDSVGDFGTLIEFAKWARTCGIQVIHIYIETLSGNLIDPIHANVDFVCTEQTLHGIREAKLAAITWLYRTWQEKSRGLDSALSQFAGTFPWVASASDGEFGIWVQHLLFEQLATAYAHCLQDGIQLMVDFLVEPGFETFPHRLIGWGHFASIVRVVQPGLVLFSPVPLQRVQEIFRNVPEVVDLVLTQFCTVEGGVATPLVQSMNQDWFVHALDMLTAKLGVSLKSKVLTQIPKLWDVSHEEPCKILQRVAQDCPATLVMDETASTWFGPKSVLERYQLIPSGSELIADCPSFLVPKWLSPDAISEFPQDVGAQEVVTVVGKRMRCPAEGVTVYLHDLIAATGHLPRQQPQELQLITGHCRFLFPMTIAELRKNTALRDDICALIERAHR